MKEIKAWKTTGGKIFEFKVDAEWDERYWDRRIWLKCWLYKHGCPEPNEEYADKLAKMLDDFENGEGR